MKQPHAALYADNTFCVLEDNSGRKGEGELAYWERKMLVRVTKISKNTYGWKQFFKLPSVARPILALDESHSERENATLWESERHWRSKQVEQGRLKAKGRSVAQDCMQEVILFWRKQKSGTWRKVLRGASVLIPLSETTVSQSAWWEESLL